MKETSGLSSTSTSSFDSKSSMSGVKVNQCEMDGPAQEKGDMDEKPLDSSLMETLKYVDRATQHSLVQKPGSQLGKIIHNFCQIEKLDTKMIFNICVTFKKIK